MSAEPYILMTPMFLIVEDMLEDAVLITHAIEKCYPKAKIYKAGTLKETYVELEKREHTAIILDLNLPDSTGTGTVEAVREKDPHTPIIAATSLWSSLIADEAKKFGANEVISKLEIMTPQFEKTILSHVMGIDIDID